MSKLRVTSSMLSKVAAKGITKDQKKQVTAAPAPKVAMRVKLPGKYDQPATTNKSGNGSKPTLYATKPMFMKSVSPLDVAIQQNAPTGLPRVDYNKWNSDYIPDKEENLIAEDLTPAEMKEIENAAGSPEDEKKEKNKTLYIVIVISILVLVMAYIFTRKA